MTGTGQRSFDIASTHGHRLVGWRIPHETPQGVIVILHGVGEHSGCYRALAENLAGRLAVDLVGFDLRGHGKSPGKRGVVRHYDDLLDDVEATLDQVRVQRPDLPIYLLGHSNGGLVALRTVLERTSHVIAGLILSNPVLKLSARATHMQRFMAHVLHAVAPRVTLGAPLAPEKMTSDPLMQRERKADPLRHNQLCAPMFFGMERSGATVIGLAGSIVTPTLFILGGLDPVVDPCVGKDFYDRLGSSDKTLAFYPEMHHEPINELGRERVFDTIVQWIRPRCS